MAFLWIETVGDLINKLEDYPKDAKIEMIYEGYANRRIACVRQEKSIVQIIEHDPW